MKEKEYIGNEQHWEDSVNESYDQRERMNKEIQKEYENQYQEQQQPIMNNEIRAEFDVKFCYLTNEFNFRSAITPNHVFDWIESKLEDQKQYYELNMDAMMRGVEELRKELLEKDKEIKNVYRKYDEAKTSLLERRGFAQHIQKFPIINEISKAMFEPKPTNKQELKR